ncbi:MAG: sulfotransferase [Actinobacteria bacterium]|nr:sulfotransferase [Actinomycetota bacterium]
MGERMIFLVGATRSGTNLLGRMIASHPDVGAVPSESCFFSHGVARCSSGSSTLRSGRGRSASSTWSGRTSSPQCAASATTCSVPSFEPSRGRRVSCSSVHRPIATMSP